MRNNINYLERLNNVSKARYGYNYDSVHMTSLRKALVRNSYARRWNDEKAMIEFCIENNL